jgi:hypothetical protein
MKDYEESPVSNLTFLLAWLNSIIRILEVWSIATTTTKNVQWKIDCKNSFLLEKKREMFLD